LESVLTRTFSATGEATASSAEVVDIIVMRTMTFMRNLARGARSDAYNGRVVGPFVEVPGGIVRVADQRNFGMTNEPESRECALESLSSGA
jgi:hypothetical protein